MRVCVIVLVCVVFFLIPCPGDTKIYIDISSPGVRPLPIKIISKGPRAREIEWAVKGDLEATGLFEFVDPDVPGAELIVNMKADTDAGLSVLFSIRDLIENKEILKKRISSSRISIRPIAHTIADDIYKVATGKKGVFRTKITFLKDSGSGKKELWIMDWDGYNVRRLIAKGLTSSHSWSHDGRYLIYSAQRYKKWKIYTLDRRTGRESVLFYSKGLNLVGGTSPENIVAFSSSRDGNPEIYTIDIYGKNLRRLTRSIAIEVSPVFSPDGSQIAFVSDRGGTPQIYVMNKDGTGLRRVTFEGSYNTSPAWSPDGKIIAYTGRINGKNQIFVVKFDGSGNRQLTFDGNNENPSFSPDGLFIAFDSDRDGYRAIYLMRINAQWKKRITPRVMNASSPEWSPYLK